MGGRTHLNNLEQMVLAVILRLGDEAYGGAVHRELETVDRGRFTRTAVYIAIDRLVERGYLASATGESAPGRGGRPRRYLTVRAEGRAALKREASTWLRVWDGIDGLPGGAR